MADNVFLEDGVVVVELVAGVKILFGGCLGVNQGRIVLDRVGNESIRRVSGGLLGTNGHLFLIYWWWLTPLDAVMDSLALLHGQC